MDNKEKLEQKNNRLGQFIRQSITSEPFDAYVPSHLPPDPAIDMDKLSRCLEKASMSISRLNNIASDIPNKSLFLYMYVRKEALVSSQIEGTQSNLALCAMKTQPSNKSYNSWLISLKLGASATVAFEISVSAVI